MGDNTGSPAAARNPALVYSRHDLLKLRDVNNHSWAADIPADIRPRKRGKRGGVRRRFRRRWRRVPLPSIIMGNLRSINNKTDELAACTRFIHEYRESSVMCYTETWLREDIDDGCVNIDGFSLIRSDRTKDSGKQTGGGVCMYINDRWANNWTVKKKLCTQNIELLTVGVLSTTIIHSDLLPNRVYSTTCRQ